MRRGRQGHDRADVQKAYAKTCKTRCEGCQRVCPSDHVYSHIFDCCGMRVVHRLRESDLEPMIVRNPLGAGYAVGKPTDWSTYTNTVPTGNTTEEGAHAS